MISSDMDTFDVVVVGGGPPGENAADYAHRGGLSAALVESDLIGGECSYWACMPSKALLRPVELADAARALPGVPIGDHLDVAKVFARRDEFTSHHDDAGQVKWAERTGITIVRGRGRLAGIRTVEVTTSDGTLRTLTARHGVVLATGTDAAIPPIPGCASPLRGRRVR